MVYFGRVFSFSNVLFFYSVILVEECVVCVLGRKFKIFIMVSCFAVLSSYLFI